MFKKCSNINDKTSLYDKNDVKGTILCCERNLSKIYNVLAQYSGNFIGTMLLLEYCLICKNTYMLTKNEEDLLHTLEKKLYAIGTISEKSQYIILTLKKYKCTNKKLDELMLLLNKKIKRKVDEIQVFNKLNIDLYAIANLVNFPPEIVQVVINNECINTKENINILLEYADLTMTEIIENSLFYCDNFIMSMAILKGKVISGDFIIPKEYDEDIINSLEKKLYEISTITGQIDEVKNEFVKIRVKSKANIMNENQYEVNVVDVFNTLTSIKKLVLA